LKVEDSPGNFTIEKRAGHVTIRVYDRFGAAYPIEVEPGREPKR
jgi:hypothetical protein